MRLWLYVCNFEVNSTEAENSGRKFFRAHTWN